MGGDGRYSFNREREETASRHFTGSRDDFDRTLAQTPPSRDVFKRIQVEQNPCRGWMDRFSGNLLDPLRFLDQLSREYPDPFLQELTRQAAGPEQQGHAEEVQSFVRNHGRAGLAFSWAAQEGVPAARSYCLIPQLWLELPRVRSELSGVGVTDENTFVSTKETARAYTLQLRTGVHASTLGDV